MYKNLLTLALLLGAALASIVACGDASTDEIEWDYHDHNIPDAGDDTDDPGDVISPQQYFCGMPFDGAPNGQTVCEPCSQDTNCSEDSSFLCDLQMDGGTCRPAEEMPPTNPCEGYEWMEGNWACGDYYPQFGDTEPPAHDLNEVRCEVQDLNDRWCVLTCDVLHIDMDDENLIRLEPDTPLFEVQLDGSVWQCKGFSSE